MRTGNGNWPIISLDPDVAGQREKRPADRPDHGQLCFNHRRLRELEHDTQGGRGLIPNRLEPFFSSQF